MEGCAGVVDTVTSASFVGVCGAKDCGLGKTGAIGSPTRLLASGVLGASIAPSMLVTSGSSNGSVSARGACASGSTGAGASGSCALASPSGKAGASGSSMLMLPTGVFGASAASSISTASTGSTTGASTRGAPGGIIPAGCSLTTDNAPKPTTDTNPPVSIPPINPRILPLPSLSVPRDLSWVDDWANAGLDAPPRRSPCMLLLYMRRALAQ